MYDKLNPVGKLQQKNANHKRAIVNVYASDYNFLSMKHQVPFRVVVTNPRSDVVMQVQSGKDELLPPLKTSNVSIAFEFDMTIDVDDGSLNFLGKYAQGPKDARFVYVNSGTYAGQASTCWSRRAKLSLMSITPKQVNEVIARPGSRIEVTMPGVGSDGGPTCASVKGLEWKVVKN